MRQSSGYGTHFCRAILPDFSFLMQSVVKEFTSATRIEVDPYF